MTTPDDDQLPPPAYSEESAAQLLRIGGKLIAALQDYLVAAAAVRSREEDETTDDAYARVVQAMAVFDAAHLDHLDYSAPAGDIDDLEFDEELEERKPTESSSPPTPSASRPDRRDPACGLGSTTARGPGPP